MPYWLESDTFADEDVWPALSRGSADLEDRLQAAYCRLKAKASLVRRDGYLMSGRALEACRGRRRVLELLCTSVLGQPPLVHRQGDVCDCLGEAWIEGYEYRIHAFLKRNPSRLENDRNRAMKADSKDSRLRALVYERDGGCCRYCRSGPLPVNGGRNKDRRKVRSYDHVDPDKPAGPSGEGYVVACDRCNAEKGARLPAEADMVLLREPTPAERQEWLTREQAVFDRPEPARIPPQDRAGNAPDSRRDGAEPFAPGANGDGDPGANAAANPDADPVLQVRPEQAANDGVGTSARTENPPGLGRAADRIRSGAVQARASPSQPARGSTDPDIYHRRSRAPDPEYQWPAGAVPADPRREEGPSP